MFKNLWQKIKSNFNNLKLRFVGQKIGDSDQKEIEKLLLEADFGVTLTKEIIEKIKYYPKEKQVVEVLSDILIQELKPYTKVLIAEQKPTVILLVGGNGAGKTTTIAKLAHYFTPKKVHLVAGDTFRAAGSSQLALWAQDLGITVTCQNIKDPAALVYKGLEEGAGADVILIDTAGRLPEREDLMAEVAKINRIIKKFSIDWPQEIILIADGTLGQYLFDQVKGFSQHLQINGLILTKMDGNSKAGVILRIVKELKLPILALGVGETKQDFVTFNPEDFVQELLA